MNQLKRLAARLPASWQEELKRIQYRHQIHHDKFLTTEPEFKILDQLVSAGDWVIDIGANVGHYTKRLSDLVGPHGRVVAIEPVPGTFALLAANASLFRHRNVTLLNVAASDRATLVGMQIPRFDSGLANYYEASITADDGALQVMTIAIDALAITQRIKLIKIDAEGHDPIVLQGLQGILARDHPIVIAETNSPAALEKLAQFGYSGQKLKGSPNMLFR
jgi:FkbM family methyltransferase